MLRKLICLLLCLALVALTACKPTIPLQPTLHPPRMRLPLRRLPQSLPRKQRPRPRRPKPPLKRRTPLTPRSYPTC